MPDGWGLAVGTSELVLARHDAATGSAGAVEVPGYGRDGAASVPAVIHYADDGGRLVGREVLDADLLDDPRTARRTTTAIGNRSPATVAVGDRRVGHAEAAGDLLATVLAAAGVPGDAAVALAVPVESVERYETWLRETGPAAGLPAIRLVDEASAAAVGHGCDLRPGRVLLLVDAGAGAVRAAVVRVLDPGERAEGDGATPAGGRCRVLGRADDDVGGTTVDGWLAAEVLARHGLDGDGDEEARAVEGELLAACERAKREVVDAGRATVAVTHPRTGAVLDLELVLEDAGAGPAVSLADLLERHGLPARVERVVRQALRGASERGYEVADVDAALVVGGTALLPAVRDTVERLVGHDRVHADRPQDAPARGAAALAAGAGLHDRVRHDYALRCWDRARGRFEYRTCVPAGTVYPTDEPVATVVLKASHDGQRELGLAVYELGESGGGERRELVLDPSGGWRLEAPTPPDERSRRRVWVNERRPTYLVADPPAQAGEARFRVELGVDAAGRLVLTAHDLVSGDTVLRDHPVVDLRAASREDNP